MFSANPSISATGLKSLDVEKGRGNGIKLGGNGVRLEGEEGRTRRGNGVGLGGEWGQTGGERGRTRGKRGRTGGSDAGSDEVEGSNYMASKFFPGLTSFC